MAALTFTFTWHETFTSFHEEIPLFNLFGCSILAHFAALMQYILITKTFYMFMRPAFCECMESIRGVIEQPMPIWSTTLANVIIYNYGNLYISIAMCITNYHHDNAHASAVGTLSYPNTLGPGLACSDEYELSIWQE